jgi:DNA mismatch endonuclease (patch repair protein)
LVNDLADRISEHRRSYNMRQIKSKDTSPEIVVRRMIYRSGFRYRLHRKDLPGRPDLVFISRRKAIFVHGCFWHQHPSSSCADSRLPKSRVGYWEPKLQRNVIRDAENQSALSQNGWQVLILWECEIESEPGETEKTLLDFLS